jgi:hypothetical protein
MEINITKNYLAVLFVLWISPIINAVWGGPIWITISFMCFFLIYAGHEWMHVWICRIHDLNIDSVNLQTGGKTYILFEPAEGKSKNKIESDVYLAGVVWDSIFFAIAIFSAIFFAMSQRDSLPFTFGISLVLLLIFNLAMPGSDWQEFHKRATKRV